MEYPIKSSENVYKVNQPADIRRAFWWPVALVGV